MFNFGRCTKCGGTYPLQNRGPYDPPYCICPIIPTTFSSQTAPYSLNYYNSDKDYDTCNGKLF